MAVFGDGSGYAVYDSETGDRLGSLVVIGITGQEDFVTNDLDGDGINELGVVFPAGIEYFRYTGEPWIDGEGGG